MEAKYSVACFWVVAINKLINMQFKKNQTCVTVNNFSNKIISHYAVIFLR